MKRVSYFRMCVPGQKRAEDSEGTDVIGRDIFQRFMEALDIVQTYFGEAQELIWTGKAEQRFSGDLPEPDGLPPENAAQPEPDPVLLHYILLPIKKGTD
jgi:hypothetical protein